GRHTRSTRDWSSDVCSSDLSIGGVDLLPIDHHARGPGIAQDCQHIPNEALLPFGRAVRQVLDRFGLPGVADEVRQLRHQGNSLETGRASGRVLGYVWSLDWR